MLLRRGRRHCSRREREKEGGETGAVRRAGGPAGGAGAGPARGPAPAVRAGQGGPGGKGRGKGERGGRGGASRPLTPPRPPASAPHWPWARGAGPKPPPWEPRGLATHPAVPSLAARGVAGPGFSSLTAARDASRGWREEPAGGPGGGLEARPRRRGPLRAREISAPRAGRLHPRLPLPAARGASPSSSPPVPATPNPHPLGRERL